jgi:hypothetical protein
MKSGANVTQAQIYKKEVIGNNIRRKQKEYKV